MDQGFFAFLLWPKLKVSGHENKERKKRGSITCHVDQANDANQIFIIRLVDYSGKRSKEFDVLTGDQELEFHTATYGCEIEQLQHAKSVNHNYNKWLYSGRKHTNGMTRWKAKN